MKFSYFFPNYFILSFNVFLSSHMNNLTYLLPIQWHFTDYHAKNILKKQIFHLQNEKYLQSTHTLTSHPRLLNHFSLAYLSVQTTSPSNPFLNIVIPPPFSFPLPSNNYFILQLSIFLICNLFYHFIAVIFLNKKFQYPRRN